MKRGDLVTVVVAGDYGKPRPALIIQADPFESHLSVVVVPLTTEIRPAPLFRVIIHPGRDTGLRKISQLMIDKITAVPRTKVGAPIGRADSSTMHAVDCALAGFLGL